MTEGGQNKNSGVIDVVCISSSAGTNGSASLAEGENVNQKFESSTVNIVAGDQIKYNIVNAERQESVANRDKYRALIKCVNDNTLKNTTDRILEDFSSEELNQPYFQVYPQMRRVKGPDYFKGSYQEMSDMVVTTRKSWFWRRIKKIEKNQLRKEFGFLREKIDDDNFTTMDQIMHPATSQNSITALVASAGSGKTTLMRRMANRDAITSVSLQSIQKMIHYIELKEIQYSELIKPSKFLFGGLYRDEIDEEDAYQWLLDNQSKSVIYFDGLDQAKWKISKNDIRKINPFTPTDPAMLMYNILSRNLLPRVKIVISSREFRISELPPKARPFDIITLVGLTLGDAHRLFVFLIGKGGTETWERIREMSPRLLNLVSTPVFLVLTAVIMAKDPTKPPPTTVTDLYKRIVTALSDVENMRRIKENGNIIDKLKAMAYRGMREGRVVFYEKDFIRYGISKDEADDLMIKVPGNKLLSRNLLEGDFLFFFCHQSLQEFFAAIFIADKTLTNFIIFTNKHLHKERWSVVRRFVCGIIFDKSTERHFEVSDRTKKQHILTKSIRSQLEKKKKFGDSYIRMELFTAIYESNNEDLIKLISEINVSGISLSRDEAHIIGSLAARKSSVDYLGLFKCDINDDRLGVITKSVKDGIHVDRVDLSDNNFSAKALRSLLGHRQIESLSGNLDWRVVMLNNTDGFGIELRNEEDMIEISDDVEGHFNIKQSTLVFDRVVFLDVALFCGILFEAKYIECSENLYAKHNELPELAKSSLEKISKILLDCTENENIDWSLIEISFKKYQVESLDIAVNGRTSANNYNTILMRCKKMIHLGFRINIHAMFFVEKEGDFKMIVEDCQRKQIEYIRCIFGVGCHAKLDEILSLVNNPVSKKVTLRYYDENGVLRAEEELKKVRKNANDLDTELEVLYLYGRVGDGWQPIDHEFYSRINPYPAQTAA